MAAGVLLGYPGSIPAAEVGLSTAGASYAPMDASKESAHDPLVPMSAEERETLVKEFKGLVSMGVERTVYERWPGRPMSDCYPRNSVMGGVEAPEGWMYRCEMMTGRGDGFYYFYPSQSRRGATLQHVDIRLEAYDPKLLDDVRRSLHPLLGVPIRPPADLKPVATAKGMIHHWDTGADVAYLFDDAPPTRPQGSVRFLWSRSPLAGNHQADAR
ncbi:MAG TPA: hypothetical protein VMU17_01955 [Elusimicrobiota bacterium]|nr:hypothetical protein [Elusimicrobiota bacterium]